MRHTRKRLLKWVGLAALAFVTFAAGVQLAFPYARLKERLLAAASADYEIHIDRLERGWLPGRFAMHGVRIATRSPDPVRFAFDRVDLVVGVVPLLRHRLDLDVDATGPRARIRGQIQESGDDLLLDLEATDLPLALVAGMPTAGALRLELRLALPSGRLEAARGDLDVACDACTAAHPPMKDARLAGHLAVKNGVACITALRVSSAASELTIEGGVRFGDDLGDIRADLVARPSGARHPSTLVHTARARLGELDWRAAPDAPSVVDCSGLASPDPAGADGVAAVAPAIRPRIVLPPAPPPPAGSIAPIDPPPPDAPAIDPPPPDAPAGDPPVAVQVVEPEVPIEAPVPGRPAEETAPPLPIEY